MLPAIRGPLLMLRGCAAVVRNGIVGSSASSPLSSLAKARSAGPEGLHLLLHLVFAAALAFTPAVVQSFWNHQQKQGSRKPDFPFLCACPILSPASPIALRVGSHRYSPSFSSHAVGSQGPQANPGADELQTPKSPCAGTGFSYLAPRKKLPSQTAKWTASALTTWLPVAATTRIPSRPSKDPDGAEQQKCRHSEYHQMPRTKQIKHSDTTRGAIVPQIAHAAPNTGLMPDP
jgi:hypothetical protein